MMVTELKLYPAYKDSGVPWLGQVPEHWESNRLGHVSTLMVPMRDKPEDLTGPIPWIRIEDFNGRSIASSQSGQGVSADTIRAMNLKVFPVGTVLCSCSCSMGTVAIAARPIVTNQTFIGIVPGVTFSSEYLFYLLQAAKDYLTQIATGAIQTYLSRSEFSSLGIVVPPLIEQQAIVRYLDHVDRKVRHAIRARQQLIKLLTEQKQAIINRAVTRGLDPNVRLKPSGVPWLGDIPEHWEVRRLKSLLGARITDGPHVTPTFVSDGVPFLSVDGIQNGDLVFETCRYVSPEDHAEFRKKTSPHRDDILLGKAASTGKIARVKVDFEFSIWSPLALIRPDQFQVVSPFLEYALKDFSSQAQIETLCTLNTQKNISMDDIPRVLLPLPPIAEQLAIVHHIEDATTNLDLAIDAARRETDFLREYRTRLIADVVTGKLDVRDVPVPADETDVLPEELESIDDVEATDESDDVAETDPSSEESA